MEAPQKLRFIVEIPIPMDDLGLSLFQEMPISKNANPMVKFLNVLGHTTFRPGHPDTMVGLEAGR